MRMAPSRPQLWRGGLRHLALRRQAGFTLLELLMVIFILASVAGGVLVVYDGIAEDAQLAVARAEMAELKKALLRFRQDTGYFPRQTTGPFIFENIPDDRFPDWVPEAQRRAWFDSEYNFWLLYGREDDTDNPATPQRENCPLAPDHPLCTWNPDSNRGWRGPYLTRHAEGLVDVPDDSDNEIPNVRGVADPFEASPDCDGDPAVPDGCTFEWRQTASSPDRRRWGRPYRLLGVDGNNARIVSLGPDGEYASPDSSDLCVPADDADDLVLCLLQ
jgi:prepilin-type N-terminal cleavage/methylation domain-containing protein